MSLSASMVYININISIKRNNRVPSPLSLTFAFYLDQQCVRKSLFHVDIMSVKGSRVEQKLFSRNFYAGTNAEDSENGWILMKIPGAKCLQNLGRFQQCQNLSSPVPVSGLRTIFKS